MAEEVMIEYYSIEAPCNSQYDAHLLQNKILSDMTPIHSPEVSPQISQIKIEHPDQEGYCHNNKDGEHHHHVITPFKLDNQHLHNIHAEVNNNFTLDGRFNNTSVLQKDQNISSQQIGLNINENLLHVKKKECELANELSPIMSEVNAQSNKTTESKLSDFQKITVSNNCKAQLKVDTSFEGVQVDDAEKQKVPALKAEVVKRIAGKKNLEEICEKYDNFMFLKFLRARDGSVNNAASMFVDFLQWRVDNQVESIDEFQFTEYDQVQKFYPHGFHGVDNEGRPIWVESLGSLKLKNLMTVTNQDRLKKYFIQNFERLLNEIFPACSQNAKKPVHQYIIVLDMKDHNLGLSELKNFLNMTSSITKNNYPEILYKMYIINAGSFFTVVWKGVKYILNEKTRNKVEILGSNFTKVINGKIKIQNIPNQIGGQCEHCALIQQSNQPNPKRFFSSNISMFLKD